MKLSAVIFDLDGTVVADEDEWGKAFKAVLSGLGVKVNSDYPHIGGIGVEENWEKFIKKYDIKTDKTVLDLTLETVKEYERLIPQVTLKPGITALIQDLRDSGIRTALATSSAWSIASKLFDHLGIGDYFDVVTTGEEVQNKKPDPQAFLITADKLGVAPEECLIFEDSAAGVEAAHEAGMKVIAIYRDEAHKDSLKNADLLIESFEKVTPEMLQEI